MTRSVASIALACLLLLAQWTAFSMVLCIRGADHVELESLNAPCCRPHAPRPGLSEDTRGACAGCKDLSIETASAWDPSRKLGTNGALAVVEAFAPVRAAAREAALVGARPPLVFVPSAAAAPLRC